MALPTLRAVGLVCAFLLSGCGGDDSVRHNPPTPTPSTVVVRGSTSGLIGTLVLQNNGGDDLTVTADGTFQFANPIQKGAAYAVTILKQPAGPTCALANATGTAAADVNTITVTCFGDPQTVYFPMLAYPSQGSNGTGGVTGLAVVSTHEPAYPPILAVKEGVQSMNLLRTSDGNPYALIYTTDHLDGSNHVWSLDLTSMSKLTPTQLSNLTLPVFQTSIGGHPFGHYFCSVTPIAKNLGDPSSAFLIVSVPVNSTDLCLGPSAHEHRLLIHLTDSASTAPVDLPTLGSNVTPLYGGDGALTGLLAVDTGNHLNLYSDETFTNPTQLLANVGDFSTAPSPVDGQPTVAYLEVLPPGITSVGPLAGGSVYKIDSTGLSADLYDFRGIDASGLRVVDGNHAYLLDRVTNGTSTTGAVVQIVQGVAQTLYTYPASVPILSGFVNQHLIFGVNFDPVDALAVGAPSTPVAIAHDSDGPLTFWAGNYLLVDHGVFTSKTAPAETEILDVTGAAVRPPLANSFFIATEPALLMFNNLPDPHSLAGAELDVMDANQPSVAGTPLKTASGATFTWPAGTDVPTVYPLTFKAALATYPQTSDGSSNVFELDLSSRVVTPISIPNSTLTPLL